MAKTEKTQFIVTKTTTIRVAVEAETSDQAEQDIAKGKEMSRTSQVSVQPRATATPATGPTGATAASPSGAAPSGSGGRS